MSKYDRPTPLAKTMDVYDVLVAFEVHCPARQHAIKKLLCAGIRGKGDTAQDLQEAGQAVHRARELNNEQVRILGEAT